MYSGIMKLSVMYHLALTLCRLRTEFMYRVHLMGVQGMDMRYVETKVYLKFWSGWFYCIEVLGVIDVE